jgi:prevent-host-death family protein
MTIVVNIGEAKTRLSELVAKVEAGEDVVIARDNRPVARLAPLAEQARARAILEDTLAARDANPNRRASQEEILAWRHESHSR